MKHPTIQFKMTLLFVMYMLQNIYTGLTWVLLPILMRKQGFGLSEIGFSVLVYSPWALKFLYASQVDRWHFPWLGRRKSWFAPFMILTCLALPVLAFLDPQTQLDKVLMVVFFLNLCTSTADIAVDGYATDILQPHEMPMGNTIQMSGYWTGMLIGSSFFIRLYESSGWSHTFMALTGLYCLLTVPVLLHGEIKPLTSAETVQRAEDNRPSALAFVRTGSFLYVVMFLIISSLVMRAGSQLRFPMLVDKGFNTDDIGKLMMYFGTPMSILGSVIGGACIKRMGEGKVFVAGCLMSAVVGLWSVGLLKLQHPSIHEASVMFAVEYLMMGMMMVLAYNLIMKVSAGPQSATNFAVLCASNHIISFIVMSAMGVLCDQTGYIILFSALTATALLLIIPGRGLILNRILSPPDESLHEKPMKMAG